MRVRFTKREERTITLEKFADTYDLTLDIEEIEGMSKFWATLRNCRHDNQTHSEVYGHGKTTILAIQDLAKNMSNRSIFIYDRCRFVVKTPTIVFP